VVAAKSSIEAIVDADLDVMATLLDATKSPVLALAINPALGVIRKVPALRDAMFREPSSNVEGYRALLVWLSLRRSDLVAKGTRMRPLPRLLRPLPSAYRWFQLVYAALALNFLIPAASYVIAPE